jgi:hypothetical protein
MMIRYICNSMHIVMPLYTNSYVYILSQTVHVYRLVTSGTIEEKIMKLQGVKLAMSEAIVNSENSTMYSMGTDRLLDLFSFNTTNGDSNKKQRSANNFSQVLDGLLDQEEEYATLTVNDFLRDISSSVDASSG